MSQPVQADDQALGQVRVLIVDDHDLFRSGLRNLLEDEGVHVVGEAAAGQEALNIVRLYGLTHAGPPPPGRGRTKSSGG
jgi:PleD family two-component response regulator